jgi:glycosyltransferase involved in cell wall biosynthesis
MLKFRNSAIFVRLMNAHIWQIIWYAFAATAGIQLLYYLFFFSRLAFYRRKKADEEAMPVPLSVVICAKDEEHNLTRNLPSVLQQRYMGADHTPSYEVIVVNDNSADDSVHYLKSIQPGYAHFRYIDIRQEAKGIQGKKYPLTIGLKGAAHESVVLTDADCKPSSVDWLQSMSEGFRNGREIVLGYGAYYKRPGLLNKVIRYETFFSALQYLSFALAGIPYMGVGRNLAYKKALFFLHKGFLSHQHLPSGDDDLFINSAATGRNTSVILGKEAFTYSEPKHTWGAWFRQKTRHYSTGKHYKFKHKFLLGLFSFSQFWYYPLFILALFYPPFLYITLGIFVFRLLLQLLIFQRSLHKLDEKDLLFHCLLFDMLLWLYYLIFTPPVLQRPKRSKWK